jgi:hypothetical protein
MLEYFIFFILYLVAQLKNFDQIYGPNRRNLMPPGRNKYALAVLAKGEI